MKRKPILLFAAFFIVVTLLVACGADTGQEDRHSESSLDTENERVSINFFTVRDDLLITHYPAWFTAFDELHPEIDVIASTSKNYEDDLQIMMAANDMPDVFEFTGIIYTNALKSAYLMPLDDVFPDLVSQWTNNSANINTDDDLTYALSYGLQGSGIVYNKLIFSELGLSPPKTLDELITVGQIIKDSGNIGLIGCAKPGWTLLPYLHIANVHMDDQVAYHEMMLENDDPFSIDCPFGISMLVFKTLIDAGIMEDDLFAYDWEQYLRDFGSGKAGMVYTWTNTAVQFIDRGDGSLTFDDLGMVPFPYDNSGGPYRMNIGADYGLAISKNTLNPYEAITFFRWHMDDLYQEYINASSILSAREGVYSKVAFLEEIYTHSPVEVNELPLSDEYLNRMARAQWNRTSQYVEIAEGYQIQEILDRLNLAWSTAR